MTGTEGTVSLPFTIQRTVFYISLIVTSSSKHIYLQYNTALYLIKRGGTSSYHLHRTFTIRS